MLLEKKGARTHRIRQCGNEVLCIVYDAAEGESEAAKHTMRLISLLVSYGERVLAPRAAEAMASAAATGALSQIRRWHYLIGYTEEVVADGCRITVRTVLRKGNEILRTDTLDTYWDAGGRYQLLPPVKGKMARSGSCFRAGRRKKV